MHLPNIVKQIGKTDGFGANTGRTGADTRGIFWSGIRAGDSGAIRIPDMGIHEL